MKSRGLPVVGLPLGLPGLDVPFSAGERPHRQLDGHAGGWMGPGPNHVLRDQLRRCKCLFLILAVGLAIF